MLALALSMSVALFAEPDLPAKPDLLLITVDTLRPDALGWVSGRNATPAIDGLAASSWRFPRAVAPAPLTLPAHASIFTALFPRRHGVRDNGRVLPESGPETLAERLRAAGYDTAAFVSGFPLAAPFGLDRGFGHYDDHFAGGRERLERPAADTGRLAAEWGAKRPGPWFLWVHFYDPHDPYEGATGSDSAAQRAAYDAEVRRVDRAIGELVAALDRSRRPRLTIFAADHGESLGEHGETTHGYFVYQSTIEVPLLFSYPGRIGPGESTERARLVDLAPTVLDLLGLAPWRDRDGVSLSPLFSGRMSSVPAALVESRRPWHSYGWAPLESVLDGRWKLIAAPKPELYDLDADPGELRNRIDEERPRARRLQRSLQELRSTAAAPTANLRDDAETVAKLRSLGYAGGTATGRDAPPSGLADPKDRIELWNLLGQGEAALDRGRPAQALALFDRVLAVDPENPFALARSSDALVRLGNDAAALPRLLRAVSLAPEQAEIRQSLVEVLHRERRFPEAVPHWLELVHGRPRDPSVWQGLGTALGLSGRPTDALVAFDEAVQLTPESSEARIRLAFAALGAQDRTRAVTELQTAARLAPAGAFRHSGTLGVLLEDLGRAKEALPWLEKSERGDPDYAEARFRLARQLAAEGRTVEARAALADAISSDPAIRSRAAADPVLSRFP